MVNVCTVTKSPSQDNIRVAQQAEIPTRSEPFIFVMSTMAASRLIESRPLTQGTGQVIVARGADNILPLVSFYDIVTSKPTKPAHRSKKMVLTLGVPSTLQRQTSGTSELMKDESKANAVYQPM